MTQGSRRRDRTARRRFRCANFPLPEPEPGAVVMKVHYSGICGTDKHTFRGESKQYAGTPHERDLTYPLICGHENVGEVVATRWRRAATAKAARSRSATASCLARTSPAASAISAATAIPITCARTCEDYGNSLHCGPAPHLFGGWAEYMYLLPDTPIFRVPDDLPDMSRC